MQISRGNPLQFFWSNFSFSYDTLEIWLVAYLMLFAYDFAVLLHGWSKHTLLCPPPSVVSYSALLPSVFSKDSHLWEDHPPNSALSIPSGNLAVGSVRAGSELLPCAIGQIGREICSVTCYFANKEPKTRSLSDKWLRKDLGCPMLHVKSTFTSPETQGFWTESQSGNASGVISIAALYPLPLPNSPAQAFISRVRKLSPWDIRSFAQVPVASSLL